MPIFERRERRPESPRSSVVEVVAVMRRPSEDSIRTEFCEGPLLDDDPTELAEAAATAHEGRDGVTEAWDLSLPTADCSNELLRCDRTELIESIKRSQTASWHASRSTKAAVPQTAAGRESVTISRQSPSYAPLLPAIKLKGPLSPEQTAQNEDAQASNLQAGLEIQRPRSALHAGDFTEAPKPRGDGPATRPGPNEGVPTVTSRHSPNRAHFPSPSIDIDPSRRPSSLRHLPAQHEHYDSPFDLAPRRARPRPPSLNSFSGFVYMSPTSPLVQQESNEDLPGTAQSPTKASRRKTMPADELQSLRSLPSSLAQVARQPASFQTDVSFSSHFRESRRSATYGGNAFGSMSPPFFSGVRSRRTSFSGENSPLQPSSMVGSYEESILRGRMSTTPSKPVDFTAQIGALGKGDCKPKFPDHVVLNFPAVYYNWSPIDAGTNTEPSPYVGQIDLEHGLPPPKRRERRQRARHEDKMSEVTVAVDVAQREASVERKKQRKRSKSPSSKRPPGGSYRIPQQGQLQILIKNPNKTAVKLFLVPYDLQDMQAGTKTFVRQNAYSAGPIIDTPLRTHARSQSTSDAKSPAASAIGERATLRYSIHLHICCPSQGRYYLYKSIKIVFANRVPDNKERLRNEIRLPEPRYSPYKPSSEILPPPSPGPLRRSHDKENRRRSYRMPESSSGLWSPPLIGREPNSQSQIPGVPLTPQILESTREHGSVSPLVNKSYGKMLSPQNRRYMPIPPSGTQQNQQEPQQQSQDRITADLPDRSNSLRSSSSSGTATSNDSAYSKLSRGDVGYGGLFARPGTPEYPESLLSQKLRRTSRVRETGMGDKSGGGGAGKENGTATSASFLAADGSGMSA